MVVVLTPEDERALIRALRRPVGRYTYTRASQLSGVPTRTLHHWASNGFFVPDFNDWSPKGWSYRDLVLVRLFAWLRSLGMKPAMATERVLEVRLGLGTREIDPKVPVRASNRAIFVEGEDWDRLTGQRLLPSMVNLLEAFDLMEPVDDVERMSGPNLLRPSRFTAITPSVAAGEPYVMQTRIPTATLFALNTEQGLRAGDIVGLFPGITEEKVEDALDLERRIRVVDQVA